jgi:hypothetical protein
MAAFLDSGGLKTGTPLDIASVPLMATAPAENARKINHKVMGWAICKSGGGVAGTREWVKTLITPTIIIPAKLKIKR